MLRDSDANYDWMVSVDQFCIEQSEESPRTMMAWTWSVEIMLLAEIEGVARCHVYYHCCSIVWKPSMSTTSCSIAILLAVLCKIDPLLSKLYQISKTVWELWISILVYFCVWYPYAGVLGVKSRWPLRVSDCSSSYPSPGSGITTHRVTELKIIIQNPQKKPKAAGSAIMTL